MNPTGMFKDGVRQQEYTSKEVPAFSGRLLPEFNKRRNIKDMFARKPSLKTAESTVDSGSGTAKTFSQALSESIETSSTRPTPAEEARAQRLADPTDVSENIGKRQSPERKRSALSSSPTQTFKRSKSNVTSNPPTTPGKGQQSLRGFFKPKSVANSTEVSDNSSTGKRAK